MTHRQPGVFVHKCASNRELEDQPSQHDRKPSSMRGGTFPTLNWISDGPKCRSLGSEPRFLFCFGYVINVSVKNWMNGDIAMVKLTIAVAATIAICMVVPATTYADRFFVIRDQNGQTAVTDGLPGYGWSVQSGPYASIDAAERATGTGTGSSWVFNHHRSRNFPQVLPRRQGQAPVTELTP